jgi:hypothetical protein
MLIVPVSLAVIVSLVSLWMESAPLFVFRQTPVETISKKSPKQKVDLVE